MTTPLVRGHRAVFIFVATALLTACAALFSVDEINTADPSLNDAGTPAPDGASTPLINADDFAITVEPPLVRLSQGTTSKLRVTITRGGANVSAIAVEVLGLPTGVSAAPLSIPRAGPFGDVAITASGDAPVADVTITVAATADGHRHEVKTKLLVAGPPGTLDTTFGDGGVTVLGSGSATDDVTSISALLIDPDDRILVAGGTTSTNDGVAAFVAARFTPAGAADPSFHGTGVVTKVSPGQLAVADGAVLLQDGTLLLVGSDGKSLTSLRLAADGGTSSFAVAPSTLHAGDAVLRDTGRVVVAGTFDDAGTAGLVQIDPATGALDPAFGDAGSLPTSLEANVRAAVIAPDGRVTIAANVNRRFSACVLLSFAANGSDAGVTTGLATERCLVNDMAIDQEGFRGVTGRTQGVPEPQQITAMLFPSTEGDRPWDFDGSAPQLPYVATGTIGNGIAFDGAGRLVLVGSATSLVDTTITQAFLVARLERDGTADPSFQPKKGVITGIGETAEAHRVAIQKDGRIVVAGTTRLAKEPISKIALARYWP